MSERNSTPSPISGFPSGGGETGHHLTSDDLTADLDLGFDGAEDILRVWRNGMRPDPDLTVSEWADAHRWLSSRAAADPGRYRTARTPYLRGIMDALSPSHPAQRISFMKAAQVGATCPAMGGIGAHPSPATGCRPNGTGSTPPRMHRRRSCRSRPGSNLAARPSPNAAFMPNRSTGKSPRNANARPNWGSTSGGRDHRRRRRGAALGPATPRTSRPTHRTMTIGTMRTRTGNPGFRRRDDAPQPDRPARSSTRH